jgi:hypothetical protein
MGRCKNLSHRNFVVRKKSYVERNVEMGIQKELNNYEASLVLRGIACCYAQFKVPLSWELSVAVYPELVEGSSLVL